MNVNDEILRSENSLTIDRLEDYSCIRDYWYKHEQIALIVDRFNQKFAYIFGQRYVFANLADAKRYIDNKPIRYTIK